MGVGSATVGEISPSNKPKEFGLQPGQHGQHQRGYRDSDPIMTSLMGKEDIRRK